ncbi:hypothetical protein EZS27_025183, partial [termite gut metagenome]
MAKSDKVVKRGIYLYIDSQEIKNDIKSIETEMRTLISAQKRMTIGSEEYQRAAQKIRTLRGIVREHNDSLRQTREQLDENTNSFSKYRGKLLGFVAGLTGAFAGMKKAVDEYLQLDSAYSDVMKYTSMTRDEVLELNESFKEMDTKTARKELNALAGDAGRLGITAKEDILDFVQAADIIRVSLGEDLGEDAIKNIGKLSQIFGNDKKMGLKNAMLATGSAINDIAQSSSASEPYLVEFTSRMAGVGKQADISVPKLIGFASVMDQNAMNVQAASTALQAVIMKMYQDPAKMAKIAGMEVKSFSKLVKEDANEAVLQLLSTLNQKGGMERLAPVFKAMKLNGAEASKALSILSADIDKVRGQQAQATIAFEKGTSVIDEFNVKNNDLSAQMEKGKKVLQERVFDLGEQLVPVMLKLVAAGGMTLGILKDLLVLALKYSDVLLVLGVSIASYNIALKVKVIWTERDVIATKAAAVANGILKGSLYLLQVAYYGLTGQLSKARGAMVAFNLVTRLNPIGALVSLIAALAGAFLLLAKHASAYYNINSVNEKVTEKVNEALQAQKQKVKDLTGIIHNNTISIDDRRQAIENLKKIMPEYNAQISEEGVVINENTEALKRENKELAMNIEFREISAELTKRENSIAQLKNSPAFKDNSLMGSMAREDVRGKIEAEEAVIASLKERYEGLKDTQREFFEKKNLRTIEQVTAQLEQANKRVNELLSMSDFEKSNLDYSFDKMLLDVKDKVKELEKEKKKLSGDTDKTGDTEPAGVDIKQKDIFLKVEAEYNKKRAEIKNQYLKGEIATQEEYNRQAEELELDLLHAKLKVAGVEPKRRDQIEQQILDSKIKLMGELEKMDDSLYMSEEEKDRRDLERIKKKYDAMVQVVEQAYTAGIIPTEEEKSRILSGLREKQVEEEKKGWEKVAADKIKEDDKQMAASVFALNERRMKENMSEKTYNEELQKINLDFISQKLFTFQLSEEQITELQKQGQEIRLKQFDEAQEKELNRQKVYAEMMNDIGTVMGESIVNLFAQGEEGMKGFMKNILNLMIDSLHK